MPDASTLPDADTRRRIGPWHPENVPSLGDFEGDTNFLVRAAAGSGKTTSLVARIVALVRTGVPIRDCAAITFTRKAASEMRARLHTELRQTRARLETASSSSSTQKRRVADALDVLPRCFIGTIHAFCSRLLREHPVAAGIPPDFTAGLDDRERDEQRQRVWQSYLSSVWDENSDRVEHIVSLGIEPSDLDHFFGELCRYPDLDPYIDGPDSPPNLESTVETLREKVTRWSDGLPDDPGDGDAKPGPTARAVRHAERMLDVHPMNDPASQAEFVALFEGLTKSDTRKSTDTTVRGNLTKSHWLDSDLADRLDNELLPTLEDDVVVPALNRWRAYAHNQLVEFVRPAVEQYATHRRKTGQLTYQDLLLCTRNLLREHPAARKEMQNRYPRLLVDEFQDTDPVQAELLFYLASRSPNETDWQACQPRDGSLFIVGDDKQSIYRFRRADLDVYRTVQETIDRAPNGEDVTLSTNFRSVSSLLDWCNRTFRPLFDRHNAPYQAPYVPFEAARESIRAEPVLKLSVPYVKGASSTRQIARRNADQVAALIAEACSPSKDSPLAGDAPGDFMVLTRNTTRLDEFAEAFAEQDLPYTMAGGDDVKESTELYALVTLLTCIERPQDPVARVAYLRGPLVGLSDDALYRFRAAGGEFTGRFHLPSSISDELTADLAQRLETAYAHLRNAEHRLETHRPAAALEQIIDRLGLLARARRDAGMGSLHAGRLLRVLTEIQRLDAEGHSWTTIRDELQLILDGERSLDGITLETGRADAIRLLNVHKAKGLEAPVVFLADPYGGKHPKSPDEHVRRQTGEVVLPVYEEHRFHRTLRFAPVRWNEHFQEVEERYQRAEEDRLLYVASTRPEEQLIVSRYRSPSWGREKGYWAPLYRFLDDAPSVEVPQQRMRTSDTTKRSAPSVVTSHQRADIERATYKTSTVTAAPEDDRDAYGSRGYGRAFGTVMHRLFEHVIQHRGSIVTMESELDAVVESLLAEHDAIEHQSTATQILRQFLDSGLWSSLQEAETVHTELPVTGRSDADVPSLMHGTIDLLYQREGTWHLVDFKTDRRSDEETARNRYREQLLQYAALWTKATGQSIDRASIWRALPGREVVLRDDVPGSESYMSNPDDGS